MSKENIIELTQILHKEKKEENFENYSLLTIVPYKKREMGKYSIILKKIDQTIIYVIGNRWK